MRKFTANELHAYLQEAEDRPLLLDVREPWEFQTCHIEGSELLPMGRIASEAGQRLDPNRETVVICHHGIRSMAVARFLEREFDFSNVINLSGGVAAWARDVDPHMPSY